MMTREIISGRKTEGSTVCSINCDRSSHIAIFVLKRDVKLQLTNTHSSCVGWFHKTVVLL